MGAGDTGRKRDWRTHKASAGYRTQGTRIVSSTLLALDWFGGFLHTATIRLEIGPADEQSFPSVAKKLAPFYHLHHPSKGSVPGPWTRLVGLETRRLGLDMAVVWAQWDDALRRAVDLAVKGVDGDRAYWTSRISA